MEQDEGAKRDKLIAQKQEWARQGRLLTGHAGADRLPPGQTLTNGWPVLDLGIHPIIDEKRFALTLDGAVANPVKLDWAAFKALPHEESVSDMHCVTAWSNYDNRWNGVSSRTLIELARPVPKARHVVFHSVDGYTTNVRLDQFTDPDVYLVDRWNDASISREHGGPVRVLIPRLYLWKSAKWVTRIEFTVSDQPGFWEVRGYHNNADPWEEERYD
jgi:DMSO/TMAO reductase YedYZ molybdopterin-dependent catalytic subunit